MAAEKNKNKNIEKKGEKPLSLTKAFQESQLQGTRKSMEFHH